MSDGGIFLATYLAATVEWVEAFTIVLAVMTVATGGVLQMGLQMQWLQFMIGVFLLLFGVRWLAKAVARSAGLKALHDEQAEFDETRHRLESGDRHAAWLIAFKGVLLEGLEVWLIVVALGVKSSHSLLATTAALAALAMVAVLGLVAHAPLRRVPENAIKFGVGAMIVSFGTFWTLEALGGAAAWPLGDWSLPLLVAFYLVGGLAVAAVLRQRRAQEALS